MLFLCVDLNHQLFKNTKKDFSRDCFIFFVIVLKTSEIEKPSLEFVFFLFFCPNKVNRQPFVPNSSPFLFFFLIKGYLHILTVLSVIFIFA